jgi:hypothetical protein
MKGSCDRHVVVHCLTKQHLNKLCLFFKHLTPHILLGPQISGASVTTAVRYCPET